MKNLKYITEGGTNMEISSAVSRRGVRFPFAENEDKTLHNEFKVTVRTDNARHSFKYYMSGADYKNNIVVMSKKDVLQALASFIEDAINARMDFERFCSEFGYDRDSKHARRVYEACQKSLTIAEDLFGNEDLNNIVDNLKEPEEQQQKGSEASEVPVPWNIPTIDLHRLKMLPAVKIPPTYHLQKDPGNGCYLDPPGYPTYFTRSIYTAGGNSPNSGCQMVITDDQGINRCVESQDDWEGVKDYEEYNDKRDKRLRKLWVPLPLDHPRTRAWIIAVYKHLQHCYHDENATDKNDQTLIYPVPDYKLKTFKDDPQFSDEWRKAEKLSIAQANYEVRVHAKKVAVPENHMAVRLIRRFYPEYQPEINLIERPPKSKGTWYERYAERPHPENCPGDMGMKHPINRKYCQLCGWTEA